MKTKSYVRFLNRSVHFEADIELVDVLTLAIDRGALHSPASAYILDGVVPTRHRILATRQKTAGARANAVAHLTTTLFASFIKDLYEDALLYFSEVLEDAAKHGLDPGRLIGEHQSTFKSNELLSAGSWGAVVKLISDALFRSLENERSTRKLLEKVDTKLDLGVDPTKIAAALPYFEMRHLLVHNDGVVDLLFCRSFPGHNEVAGRKLHLSHQRIRRAQTAVVQLIKEFDEKIIQKGLVAATDCQP